MFRNILTILFIVTFTIRSAPGQQNPSSKANQPQTYEDLEAYQVYSAILPSDWIWSVQKAKTLAFQIETRAYQMCLRPEEKFQAMMEQAISNYIELNQKTWVLQRHFNIEKPYELIPADELKRAFKAGGWEEFHQQHPNSGGFDAAAAHGIKLEVVKLPTAKRGFVLLPRRWVVERSFGWMARFRRLAGL